MRRLSAVYVFAIWSFSAGPLLAQGSNRAHNSAASPPLCHDSSGVGGTSGAVGAAYWKDWSNASFLWGKTVPLSGLVIDFTETSCVAQPITLTVSDHQLVNIRVIGATGCVGDFATESITSVAQADALGTLFKFLGSFPTAMGGGGGVGIANGEKQITLPDLTNAKDTVTFSCNDASGKPTKIVKTVAITFQNPSPVTASAGVLISTLGKQQYGVNTSAIGVSNGLVSSQYAIGVTSRSTVQLVPIGFINVFGYGTRRTHLDLQAGVGVNPNGSKTRVEWLVGPALSTHNVYIGAGLHIAQAQYLQAGYQSGQMVGSQGFTVPTDWKTTLKLGFTLTYSPPVTASGSK